MQVKRNVCGFFLNLKYERKGPSKNPSLCSYYLHFLSFFLVHIQELINWYERDDPVNVGRHPHFQVGRRRAKTPGDIRPATTIDDKISTQNCCHG